MGNPLLGILSNGFLGGLGSLLFFLAVKCFNRGKKYQVVTAQALTAHDTRPPVLYLRSFQDDPIAASSTLAPVIRALLPLPSHTVVTEEEQLAMVMNEIGPFIAIGKPGEPLPELGAARLYVGDDEWQATIATLMARAQLVILRAGETAGFWWEVQRATQAVKPERLVFLIPYSKAQYEVFRQRAQVYLPCPLPAYSGKPAPFGSLRGILYFEPNWTPHFLVFKIPYRRGGSTVNRGHAHHRSIRRCRVREGRPRRFGGAQRDNGT